MKNFNPLHGGDIISAAAIFNIPLNQWLDLSTGINPSAYPVGDIPTAAFYQLPYLSPTFSQAVKAYYQQDHFLAVSGSQVVIQYLPQILVDQRTADQGTHHVLMPNVGYREHELHWQTLRNNIQESVSITHYDAYDHGTMISDIDYALDQNPHQHVVVINPNNPSGVMVSQSQLLAWAELLGAGHYLVVDEAFIDMTPADSLLSLGGLPNNMIVMRSFGKFFGMAGLRLGFVFACPDVLTRLSHAVGLWSVNGPAAYIAEQALQDVAWQHDIRKKISADYHLTQSLFAPLTDYSVVMENCSKLFCCYRMPQDYATVVYHTLASKGILTRVISLSDQEALLRVGNVSFDNPDAIHKIRQVMTVDMLCQLQGS